MGEQVFNRVAERAMSGSGNEWDANTQESHPISSSVIMEGKRITVSTTRESLIRTFRDFATLQGYPVEKINDTLEKVYFGFMGQNKDAGYVSSASRGLNISLNVQSAYINSSDNSPHAIQQSMYVTFLHELEHVLEVNAAENNDKFKAAGRRHRNQGKYEAALGGIIVSDFLLGAIDAYKAFVDKSSAAVGIIVFSEILLCLLLMVENPVYDGQKMKDKLGNYRKEE